MDDIRAIIARVAREEGIDPAYALAVAERESRFKPNAGGTGTIKGLFQLTGTNRRRYGVADDASVEDQVRGFGRLTKDVQREMRSAMGRDPTHEETYLGHHFGGVRGGRTAAGRYAGMSPSDVFSPLEMRGNPHFRKAGTMDALASSITGDIKRRRSKFGSEPAEGGMDGVDFAQFGWSPDSQAAMAAAPKMDGVVDFSQFGHAHPQPAANNRVMASGFDAAPTIKPPTVEAGEIPRPGKEIDLAQFGQPMAQMQQPALGGV